jgi:hypothetical protein
LHRIFDFLSYLSNCNPLYENIQIGETNLAQYPIDDMLPGIDNRVVVNQVPNPSEMFEEETAAFEPHPASALNRMEAGTSTSQRETVHIENVGLYDANAENTPARFLKASALRQLALAERPSLLAIPRSGQALSEYSNPALFPMMFPTLFPLGVAGFDDPTRRTPIAFRNQVEYFLDLADPAFRRHRSFVFVALNIWQRRLSHLHTSLAIRKPRYAHVAPKIATLKPEIIERVAKHVENEREISTLCSEEKNVFTLVKELTTISAHIPGSSAAKLTDRNNVHAYFGYFGMPLFYLTTNPNASHSPVFQCIYGDELVDITKRFPDLVNSLERRIRLASDAAAGEEFFSFSIECLLQHLLGWDAEKKRSKSGGGILGKIRAYYGVAEFTDRGQLHAHFLLWLDGALNPREIHEKMKKDPDWQNTFFEYIEDVIRHQVPDVPGAVDPEFEPRTQAAPDPSDATFDAEFLPEVKKCAEALQRHSTPCHKVCFKYGAQECRFGFPHDVVEKSTFNAETNSIKLKALDPMINWFNPWMSVFCRVNHDLKLILSGRSAKAAMIYITKYITKDDEQMHEVLSLFSKSLAAKGELDENDRLMKTRVYLQSCLAAQIRNRKVHAQQAIRYLRNKGDSIRSHEMVPMLSYALIAHVRSTIRSPALQTGSDAGVQSITSTTNSEQSKELSMEDEDDAVVMDDEDADDVDHILHRVAVDEDGTLQHTDQVEDYLHRDLTLSSVCFYDFVRCYKKVKRTTCADTLADQQFALLDLHSDAATHVLSERINPKLSRPSTELIPRVIGHKIPRRQEDDDDYALFMLAHFMPFSFSHPLNLEVGLWATFQHGMSVKDTDTLPKWLRFSQRAKRVMQNWDEIHECEDAAEEERRLKRQRIARKARAYTRDVQEQLPPEYFTDPSLIKSIDEGLAATLDPKTAFTLASLCGANWLSAYGAQHTHTARAEYTISEPFAEQLTFQKTWAAQIRAAKASRGNERRCLLDPSCHTVAEQEVSSKVLSAQDLLMLSAECDAHETEAVQLPQQVVPRNWTDVLTDIQQGFRLNQRQKWCFEICADRFQSLLTCQHGRSANRPPNSPSSLPLRFLMTGPGGTGKTYTIAAFQELMWRFNCAHLLRFLAPTGATAVNLPDGQTIHKACGIQVFDDSKSGRHALRLSITPEKKAELRAEWKGVQFLLVDEVSMVGADLLGDLDLTLRCVCEVDDWFGGINVIFAGDFFQLPPVSATPLYRPISKFSKDGRHKQSGDEARSRHGRIAWKQVDTVVELTEQKRMESDPEYAKAVLHLRVHDDLTREDIALFNSRVIKSHEHPNGVDLAHQRFQHMVAIVEWNKTRSTLNSAKAVAATTGPDAPDLVSCMARHSIGRSDVAQEIEPICCQHESSILPAELLLYIGAPVVLKVCRSMLGCGLLMNTP